MLGKLRDPEIYLFFIFLKMHSSENLFFFGCFNTVIFLMVIYK